MAASDARRTPGNLAWDLHYAHAVPGDEGGRRIFLATDRPIGAWEAINQPRTIDYPFTFIELRLNRSGEGEGKLSRAARVIRQATTAGSCISRITPLSRWSSRK